MSSKLPFAPDLDIGHKPSTFKRQKDLKEERNSGYGEDFSIILNLSKRNIWDVASLTNYKFLIELDLTENLLGNESSDDFSFFTCLRKLVLNKNKFKNIPILPKTIENLSVSSNNLQEISSRISTCQNLKKLDVSSNSITSIQGIKSSKRLECLLMASNNLRSIGCLPDMPSLKIVDLQSNQLGDSLRAVFIWLNSAEALTVVNFGENPCFEARTFGTLFQQIDLEQINKSILFTLVSAQMVKKEEKIKTGILFKEEGKIYILKGEGVLKNVAENLENSQKGPENIEIAHCSSQRKTAEDSKIYQKVPEDNELPNESTKDPNFELFSMEPLPSCKKFPVLGFNLAPSLEGSSSERNQKPMSVKPCIIAPEKTKTQRIMTQDSEKKNKEELSKSFRGMGALQPLAKNLSCSNHCRGFSTNGAQMALNKKNMSSASAKESTSIGFSSHFLCPSNTQSQTERASISNESRKLAGAQETYRLHQLMQNLSKDQADFFTSTFSKMRLDFEEKMDRLRRQNTRLATENDCLKQRLQAVTDELEKYSKTVETQSQTKFHSARIPTCTSRHGFLSKMDSPKVVSPFISSSWARKNREEESRVVKKGISSFREEAVEKNHFMRLSTSHLKESSKAWPNVQEAKNTETKKEPENLLRNFWYSSNSSFFNHSKISHAKPSFLEVFGAESPKNNNSSYQKTKTINKSYSMIEVSKIKSFCSPPASENPNEPNKVKKEKKISKKRKSTRFMSLVPSEKLEEGNLKMNSFDQGPNGAYKLISSVDLASKLRMTKCKKGNNFSSCKEGSFQIVQTKRNKSKKEKKTSQLKNQEQRSKKTEPKLSQTNQKAKNTQNKQGSTIPFFEKNDQITQSGKSFCKPVDQSGLTPSDLLKKMLKKEEDPNV